MLLNCQMYSLTSSGAQEHSRRYTMHETHSNGSKRLWLIHVGMSACPLVVLACESLHVCTVCIWRCEHARFCVEVFYALYINFHSFIIQIHQHDIHHTSQQRAIKPGAFPRWVIADAGFKVRFAENSIQ